MSRSKSDILDTENMLQRLTNLLIRSVDHGRQTPGWNETVARQHAESLRRISMTLHRWHELECGDSNDYASWTIARGRKTNGTFEYDDEGTAFLEIHTYRPKAATKYQPIPDRETAAKKRLAKILKNYPGVTAYIQGDPRGCALYILPVDALKGDETAEAYYSSRGIAVYR